MITTVEIADHDYAGGSDRHVELETSTVVAPSGEFIVRKRPGPPSGLRLVLLHGIGSTWRSWERVIPFLADDVEVTVFDLPGFGRSPRPAEGMGADHAATDINAILSELCTSDLRSGLEPRPTVLVGHSLGTLAALHVGLQRPDNVVGLIVVSGAVLSLLDLLRHPARSLVTEPLRLLKAALPVVASGLPLPDFVRRPLARNQFYQRLAMDQAVARPELLDDEVKAQSLERLHHRNVYPATANAFGYDYRATFGRLAIPVSFINGTEDQLSEPADVERLAAICGSDTITWLERVGHWPNLETPDLLARAVDRHAAAFL
ncbi:MAG: alpha/beta fold hydrolase [Acidimicrobiales bacterium]